ncbi:MAG: hypothetical protein FWF85_01145 [Clostridiales bacterium]|nr:hypothetical protein [Clostridiales bacterium]MDR2713029.1 hypothetical protein [Clostridiales bacterium]
MKLMLRKVLTVGAGLFLFALAFLLWRRGHLGSTPLQVLLPGLSLACGWLFLLAAFWQWRKAKRQLRRFDLWRVLLTAALFLLLMPYSYLIGEARLLLFQQLPLPGTDSTIKTAYQQLLEGSRWQARGKWWHGYTLTVRGRLDWEPELKRNLTITYQADRRGAFYLDKTLLEEEEMPPAFAAYIQERIFDSKKSKEPLAADLALWLLKNSRFANCEFSLEELVNFSIKDITWTARPAYSAKEDMVELAGQMNIEGTLMQVQQSYLIDMDKCTINHLEGLLDGKPQDEAAYEQWCKDLVNIYAGGQKRE